ncbi:MAG: hypothetical protein K9G26_04165 [Emcibacter sp.]|nr:hypothetical protein [Emcibacter sp.]
MKNLKGSIILICALGIYAMGSVAYAAAEPDNNKSKNLTSSILSFFSKSDEKKNVAKEVILLKKPTKENADQYITLSETKSDYKSVNSFGLESTPKKLSVRQSYMIKPTLLFNMGGMGLSDKTPSGFTNTRANTIGNHVTFSYGDDSSLSESNALDISFGSQFLIEPSLILSPLFDGSEFDQTNNRQAYNFSVDMGYAGFKIGASYGQEKMLYASALKGFDVGLGYNSHKWGADVRFGEYKREHDRLFASSEEFYNTVYAFEVGAAYQIYSNIRFTGRFTYYSYGQENDMNKIRNSQVFFLGTNVNF